METLTIKDQYICARNYTSQACVQGRREERGDERDAQREGELRRN